MAETTHPKLRIARDRIYVAWQGVAGDIDGVQYVAQRGTRLRGDHPLVRHMGAAGFVEDGTPESEWPGVFDAAVDLGEARGVEEAKARAEVQAKMPSIAPGTRIGDLMQCVQAITMSRAGTCPEGAVVLRSDPRVKLLPEAFRPLLERVVVG